jgi:hypothetical protein
MSMMLVRDGYEATDTKCPRRRPERRRGLRIRQDRPIKVFEPAAARFFAGQTLDIGATGLRIELPADAPVQAGEILTIHVSANAAGSALANRRQMMPVKVVWVDRSDAIACDSLVAGVEFLASIAAHLDAA